MSTRTQEDYEELWRLMDEAEAAFAQVQGKLMSMFPVLDPDNRVLPTRYDEKAMDIVLALGRLRSELALERHNEAAGPDNGGAA